jgi:acyl-CoA synthetase (AMP-forming)/AMP-acid ligase II
MYSGDEAVMDDQGYVSITGRIKDLIIRGGENIHPLEIENCLFGHPLVAEASVVGVPDDRYGESVAAFVVVHPGVEAVQDEKVTAAAAAAAAATTATNSGSGGGLQRKVLTKAEVRDWVRRNLSSHLVPKHVFWIGEYPKTASGKIQKYKLRETAKQLVSQAILRQGSLPV